MKKRNLLLSAFMLFAALNTAKAQVDMESMLTNFVDTTEVMINNGRRMILQNVQTRNFDKVAEIYEFLNERIREKNCDAFFYAEDLYIAILTGNWNGFLEKAEHFTKISRRPLCVPINDHMLFRALRSEVQNNTSQLLGNALMTDLTLEDKELLELYFYLFENGVDETYSRKLRAFRRKYPQSRYNDFVRNYLPDALFRVGIGFGMGATQHFPTGGLANYLAPSTAFNMSIDFYVNNFFFGFQFDGGTLRFDTPLPSNTSGYHHDFLVNDRLSYAHGGLTAGYRMVRSGRFELSPFVYLGGGTLETNFYRDPRDSDLEFRVFNTFIFGGGLRTEFNLFNFTVHDPFMGAISSRLNLRLDVGYNIPAKFQYTPMRGNIPYARLALVWWVGNP